MFKSRATVIAVALVANIVYYASLFFYLHLLRGVVTDSRVDHFFTHTVL